MLSVVAFLMVHVLVTKIFGLKMNESITDTTAGMKINTISEQKCPLNLLDHHSQLKTPNRTKWKYFTDNDLHALSCNSLKLN